MQLRLQQSNDKHYIYLINKQTNRETPTTEAHRTSGNTRDGGGGLQFDRDVYRNRPLVIALGDESLTTSEEDERNRNGGTSEDDDDDHRPDSNNKKGTSNDKHAGYWTTTTTTTTTTSKPTTKSSGDAGESYFLRTIDNDNDN